MRSLSLLFVVCVVLLTGCNEASMKARNQRDYNQMKKLQGERLAYEAEQEKVQRYLHGY